MKISIPAAMRLRRDPIRRMDPVIYLFGTVSKDATTGLFTYSYLVDNRLGSFAVSEVNLLINSAQIDLNLAPASLVTPTAWKFSVGFSGASADDPVDEFGTFWSWNIDFTTNNTGVAPGAVSPVFSFTTPRTPGVALDNNFFLFSDTAPLDPPLVGIVAFGHAVAPDFGVA